MALHKRTAWPISPVGIASSGGGEKSSWIVLALRSLAGSGVCSITLGMSVPGALPWSEVPAGGAAAAGGGAVSATRVAGIAKMPATTSTPLTAITIQPGWNFRVNNTQTY